MNKRREKKTIDKHKDTYGQEQESGRPNQEQLFSLMLASDICSASLVGESFCIHAPDRSCSFTASVERRGHWGMASSCRLRFYRTLTEGI